MVSTFISLMALAFSPPTDGLDNLSQAIKNATQSLTKQLGPSAEDVTLRVGILPISAPNTMAKETLLDAKSQLGRELSKQNQRLYILDPAGMYKLLHWNDIKENDPRLRAFPTDMPALVKKLDLDGLIVCQLEDHIQVIPETCKLSVWFVKQDSAKIVFSASVKLVNTQTQQSGTIRRSKQGNLVLKKKKTEVKLDFSKQPRLRPFAERIVGRPITICGRLHSTGGSAPGFSFQVTSVLSPEPVQVTKRVAGTPAEFENAGVCVVGYPRNRFAEAKALCEQAGMTVEQVSRGAGYVVCSWKNPKQLAQAIKTFENRPDLIEYIQPSYSTPLSPINPDFTSGGKD